jgi:hypothetical protein
MKTSGSDREVIASNIEKIEFVYLDVDNNAVNDAKNAKEIRSIQISILGRTEIDRSENYSRQKFTTPSGTEWTFTDGYKRQLLTTIVGCRNLGVQ